MGLNNSDCGGAPVGPVIWDIDRTIGGFRSHGAVQGDNAHQPIKGLSKRFGLVVVKPFTLGRVGKADMERKNYEMCNEIGAKTLDVLALEIGQERAYLVTRFIKGLRTLSGINWARGIADRSTHTKLIPQLEKTSQDIGSMHEDYGIFHGDLRVRNIAYTELNSGITPIDLEGANIFYRAKSSIPDSKSGIDLTTFGASLLVEHGFIGDRTPVFRAAALTEYILLPYTNRRQGVDIDAERLRSTWEHAARTNCLPKRNGKFETSYKITQ